MKKHYKAMVIDDYSKITLTDIQALCQSGFCYIKIDEQIKENHLTPVRNCVLDFFNNADEYKKNDNFSSTLPKTPKFASQGYLKRRTKLSSLETFRQRLDVELISPLDRFEDNITAIRKIFLQGICKSLLEKIIHSLYECKDVSQEGYFSELLFWAQFVYYPHQSFYERMIQLPGLHVHRDISYATIVFLEKKGLRVWRDGFWQDILPKSGYAVFIIGSDLAAITDNRVRSCLHYVSMNNLSERLSSVFFISPNRSKPLFSFSGVKLHDADMSLVDRDRQDSEDKASINDFFRKIIIIVNLLFLPIIASYLDFTNVEDYQLVVKNAYRVILSYLSLNIALKACDFMCFDRFKMDYLQHSRFPAYGSPDQTEAYNLGESSLTFFGFSRSILNKNSYQNRSFWNAGLLSQLVKK